MNSFNANRIVEYVKVLTDNTQCVSCGQLEGLRVRYQCGHSVCDNCVLTAESCAFCLSPPDILEHVIDGPQSLQVEHASNLLKRFQELFKIDVYRQLRVSEQLKVEKQVFPECIQAPAKYSNSKRISSVSYKENIKPILPGENTSKPHSAKMENKINYVQQWLNKNESILSEAKYDLPRKPFTDLNVNGQNVIRPKTTNKVTKKKRNLSRNKTRLKTFDPDIVDNLKLSSTRLKKDVQHAREIEIGKPIKCDNNESGIVIDDEILIINDSDSVDKDRAAWFAVLEAEKNIPMDVSDTKSHISDTEKVVNTNVVDKSIQNQIVYKVPFYKKCSLYEDHQYNKSANENVIPKSNNVTFTIETNSFVTTVKLYEDCSESKHSIGVQTDRDNFDKNCGSNTEMVELQLPRDVNTNLSENCQQISELGVNKNIDAERDFQNKDIVSPKVGQTSSHQSLNKRKVLIIDESDSDSEILATEKSSLLEVTAEVHRAETENDCNVLSQLQHGEYEHRMRHAGRGITPTSTDSSDKENFDPNRAKRRKLDKKSSIKKSFMKRKIII